LPFLGLILAAGAGKFSPRIISPRGTMLARTAIPSCCRHSCRAQESKDCSA